MGFQILDDGSFEVECKQLYSNFVVWELERVLQKCIF